MILEEFISDWLDTQDLAFTKKSKKDILGSFVYGYRGYMAANTYMRISNRIIPGKPKGQQPYYYILSLQGKKYCSNCKEIKTLKDFNSNKGRSGGLASECKICDYARTLQIAARVQAKYRAAKLKRTPNWANEERLQEIYKNCPVGHHVDHIIPYKGF